MSVSNWEASELLNVFYSFLFVLCFFSVLEGGDKPFVGRLQAEATLE